MKANITNVLKEHFIGLKHLTESSVDGNLLILFTGPRSSIITVRGYPEGLVTINIEYFKQDDDEALLSFEVIFFQLKTVIFFYFIIFIKF